MPTIEAHSGVRSPDRTPAPWKVVSSRTDRSSPRSAPPAAARTALAQLADGIADMGSGTASTWPYGAILPSVTSRSEWHPWAAQMATARVLALLATATATHSAGLRQLAGIAAGWFFGQNPAGTATYNPAIGATDDGINANGTVNLNSGAESTIFGLLTMEALDANPDVAAIARASASERARDRRQESGGRAIGGEQAAEPRP